MEWERADWISVLILSSLDAPAFSFILRGLLLGIESFLCSSLYTLPRICMLLPLPWNKKSALTTMFDTTLVAQDYYFANRGRIALDHPKSKGAGDDSNWATKSETREVCFLWDG